MGGNNDDSNLVRLTIEEHAQAHLTLYETYGKHEDLIAYRMLSGQITAKEATKLSQKMRDTSYMKTPEFREKVSKGKKGQEPWNKGKTGVQSFSEEFKQKMSKLTSGSNNPRARACIFNGVKYETFNEAVIKTGMSKYKLLRHPDFELLSL